MYPAQKKSGSASPTRLASPRRGIEAAHQTADELIRILTSIDPNTLSTTSEPPAQASSFPATPLTPSPAITADAEALTDLTTPQGRVPPSSENDSGQPSTSAYYLRPLSAGGPMHMASFKLPQDLNLRLAAAGRALSNLHLTLTTEREARARERDEYEWRLRQLETQIDAYRHEIRQSTLTGYSKDEKEAASEYLISVLRRQLETERRDRMQDRVDQAALVKEAGEARASALTLLEDARGEIKEGLAREADMRVQIREEVARRHEVEASLTSIRGALAQEQADRAAEVSSLKEAHSIELAQVKQRAFDDLQREIIAREEVERARASLESMSTLTQGMLSDQLAAALKRASELDSKVATAKVTVGALESRVEAKDQLIEELQQTVAALRDELQDTKDEAETNDHTLRERLKEKAAELTDARQVITTLQEQLGITTTEKEEAHSYFKTREGQLQAEVNDMTRSTAALRVQKEALQKRVEELEIEYREQQRMYDRQMAEIESKCQAAFEDQLEKMIAEERVRAENALFQQRLTLRNELNQREGQFKVKLDGELNELRLQIEAENASKMRRIETELERRMAEERTRYERDLYNARAAAREEISLMKARLQHEHEEFRKVRHESESYKLQLVELLAKLQGIERVMVSKEEDIELRRKEHEEYVNELRNKQAGELQSIQLVHGQKLTNLSMELERIKANAEQNAKRLIGQLRDQTTKTEEAVKYLTEAREVIRALEKTVEELKQAEVQLRKDHLEELRMLRDGFEEAICKKDDEHVDHVNKIKEEHAAELEAARQRETTLTETKFHLERALDRKEPRPEDLLKIRQLEASMYRSMDDNAALRDKLKALKLEMLMREDNYTRVFSRGGQTETLAVSNTLVTDDNLLTWMKVDYAPVVDPSFLEPGSPGGFFASSIRAQTAPAADHTLGSTLGGTGSRPISPARARSPSSPRRSISRPVEAAGVNNTLGRSVKLATGWAERRTVAQDPQSAEHTRDVVHHTRSVIIMKPGHTHDPHRPTTAGPALAATRAAPASSSQPLPRPGTTGGIQVGGESIGLYTAPRRASFKETGPSSVSAPTLAQQQRKLMFRKPQSAMERSEQTAMHKIIQLQNRSMRVRPATQEIEEVEGEDDDVLVSSSRRASLADPLQHRRTSAAIPLPITTPAADE